MRTSVRPARRATTNTGRRCTTECGAAAGLGPPRPARPLATRRTDRLQLVVGEEPPHRLAHLVGLRDPDAAGLPLAVGPRRKLDGSLLKLRARPESGWRLFARRVERHRTQSARRHQRTG